MVPPCTSFSVARDRSGVIRCRQHPWGRPGLSAADAARFADGNRNLQSCLAFSRACLGSGAAFAIENPRSSKMCL
eukprot:12548185-Alexandrium_andersonii.AAC.1